MYIPQSLIDEPIISCLRACKSLSSMALLSIDEFLLTHGYSIPDRRKSLQCKKFAAQQLMVEYCTYSGYPLPASPDTGEAGRG